MEIIEKIQLIIDDLDEVWLVSIVRTCSDMAARFRLDLTFCEKDQTKLEFIQSKRQEVQEKIKEMGMKAHYAVDLYNQHLDIELKKVSNGQAFNIPLMLNTTSIFKEKIERILDSEDGYNEMDHVECALTNAQKAGEEFIVWTIFYSELEDLEQYIQEGMDADKKYELAETTSSSSSSSSVKESREEIIIEKKDDAGLPITQTILPSKFVQIFKEGGVELFDYLQCEYSIDNSTPVAKYSYIYRFLAYEQLINARSQMKYMEFIKVTYGVNMSKIFSENDKFSDDIHHLLSRLKSNFDRKSKMEMNRK